MLQSVRFGLNVPDSNVQFPVEQYRLNGPVGRQPIEVILANGLMEDPRYWRPFVARLGEFAINAGGIDFRVTSYGDPPTDHEIGNRSQRLEAVARCVGADGGLPPILVAHSMGWLAGLRVAEKIGREGLLGLIGVSGAGHAPLKDGQFGLLDLAKIAYAEARKSESGDGRGTSWQASFASATNFVRDAWPHVCNDYRGLVRQIEYALTTDATQQAVSVSEAFGKCVRYFACQSDPIVQAKETIRRLQRAGFKGGIDEIEASHTDPFRRPRSASKIIQSIIEVFELASREAPKHPIRSIFALLLPKR